MKRWKWPQLIAVLDEDKTDSITSFCLMLLVSIHLIPTHRWVNGLGSSDGLLIVCWHKGYNPYTNALFRVFIWVELPVVLIADDHGGSVPCTSPGTDGSCVKNADTTLVPNTIRESVAINASSGNIQWLRLCFRTHNQGNQWYQYGNNFHHSSLFVSLWELIVVFFPSGGNSFSIIRFCAIAAVAGGGLSSLSSS